VNAQKKHRTFYAALEVGDLNARTTGILRIYCCEKLQIYKAIVMLRFAASLMKFKTQNGIRSRSTFVISVLNFIYVLDTSTNSEAL
jgi:hypothetical protein